MQHVLMCARLNGEFFYCCVVLSFFVSLLRLVSGAKVP